MKTEKIGREWEWRKKEVSGRNEVVGETEALKNE